MTTIFPRRQFTLWLSPEYGMRAVRGESFTLWPQMDGAAQRVPTPDEPYKVRKKALSVRLTECRYRKLPDGVWVPIS
ncbi:MAG TPA: hypothetical protein EYP14_08990 [Planctomycetaceae bacterium]|nr:hypothetical protein [Planctomycetaceae bacterium]